MAAAHGGSSHGGGGGGGGGNAGPIFKYITYFLLGVAFIYGVCWVEAYHPMWITAPIAIVPILAIMAVLYTVVFSNKKTPENPFGKCLAWVIQFSAFLLMLGMGYAFCQHFVEIWPKYHHG